MSVGMQQPIVSPLGDETYTPPEVEVGDSVLWYPTGRKSDTPCSAQVFKAPKGWRGIELLVLLPGEIKHPKQVHHVDDPILKVNPIIERKGAWGHSGASLAAATIRSQAARIDDLADRVNMLEKYMESGSKLPDIEKKK